MCDTQQPDWGAVRARLIGALKRCGRWHEAQPADRDDLIGDGLLWVADQLAAGADIDGATARAAARLREARPAPHATARRKHSQPHPADIETGRLERTGKVWTPTNALPQWERADAYGAQPDGVTW